MHTRIRDHPLDTPGNDSAGNAGKTLNRWILAFPALRPSRPLLLAGLPVLRILESGSSNENLYRRRRSRPIWRRWCRETAGDPWADDENAGFSTEPATVQAPCGSLSVVRVSSPVSTCGGVGGSGGGGGGRDHDRADDDDAASASSPLHSVINPFHPRKAAYTRRAQP
jgi:hypothetical protein